MAGLRALWARRSRKPATWDTSGPPGLCFSGLMHEHTDGKLESSTFYTGAGMRREATNYFRIFIRDDVFPARCVRFKGRYPILPLSLKKSLSRYRHCSDYE